MGAIVNRDLQRRIRPVSGVTIERCVMRADARLAARLAHQLDVRTQLWHDEGAKKQTDKNSTEVLVYANASTTACLRVNTMLFLLTA